MNPKNSLSLKQLFPLVVSQVSDMWEGEIRYEAFRQPIDSIVALLVKNGGETIPHDPLGIAQDLRMIIDHHIVISEVSPHNFV